MDFTDILPGTLSQSYPVFCIPFCFLVIVLAAIAPVSAADHTLNPGDSIQENITSAIAGDTIILNPGIYYQNRITIDRDITIRANSSARGIPENTIIDATGTGGLFFNRDGHSLTLDNLTLRNGRSSDGSVILTSSVTAPGTTNTITSSVISNCTAADGNGGAIYTNSGNLKIISTSFSNCSAHNYGGAVFAAGSTVNITSSNFTDCSAIDGGAIYDDGNLTISSSIFSGCTAAGHGGAIATFGGNITSVTITDCIAGIPGSNTGSGIYGMGGTTTVQFSRLILADSSCCGFLIYNNGGTTDARNNWWSTKYSYNSPSDHVYGDVIVDPWLVVNVTTSRSYANPGDTVIIRVNMTTNSAGVNIPDNEFLLPDGIPVVYGVTQPGAILPGNGKLMKGINTTVITVGSTGTTFFWVIVDGLFLARSISGPEGIYTLDPGNSIQDSIDSAGSGDTIILNPGVYYEHDIDITKNITIMANTSAGGWSANTIIDGQGAGRIFADLPRQQYRAFSLTVDNLTLRNGNAANSTVPGSNCISAGCAGVGGAILVAEDGGIVNVTSSSIDNCSADHGGAIAISSSTTCCSHPRLTVVSSSITNCSGPNGSALYAYYSNATVRYSRIYNNEGTAVYSENTGSPQPRSIEATHNWWGTNNDPSSFTAGTVTVSPWLVMNISAMPSSLTVSRTSLIRIRMTNTSGGTDTSGGGIFVPDGIPVAYSLGGVSGSLGSLQGYTLSGTNATMFRPATTGTASVAVAVDGQSAAITIPVDQDTTQTGGSTSESTGDFPSGESVLAAPMQAVPEPVTVTVNIGGNTRAGMAVVTGTKLSDLVITGTVQNGAGSGQSAPPGRVFQYLALEPAAYGAITGAVIHFSVPQSWLDENQIAPGSIVLYRQTAGGWEALPTTFLYAKEGTAYFSGETRGFSLFAIAWIPGEMPQASAKALSAAGSTPAPGHAVVEASVMLNPIVTETTGAPSSPEVPAGTSSLPVLPALLVAGCAGLIGCGAMARRWWIRRQNPALFREYD